MFRKIKIVLAFLLEAFYTTTMRLLLKKELTEFNNKLKSVEAETKAKMKDTLTMEVKDMSKQEKALFDQYAKLQNEILKVFMLFTKEIRESSGTEMDGIGGIWQTTVVGLNKTLALAFAHQDDVKIKQHLYVLEKELQIAIDTNQEIVGSKSGGDNGGFGYSGPIGEA
jgi:hypothetical protein